MKFQLFSKVLQKPNRINFRSAAWTAKWKVCCELVSCVSCVLHPGFDNHLLVGPQGSAGRLLQGSAAELQGLRRAAGFGPVQGKRPPSVFNLNLLFYYREVTLPFLNAGPRWGHKCLRERRLVPGEGGLCALQAQQSDGKLCRPPNSSSKQRRCVFLLCGANSRTTTANFLHFCPLIMFLLKSLFALPVFKEKKKLRQ